VADQREQPSPQRRPTRVAFDTSAFVDLCRHEGETRKRLHAAVERGRIVVVAGEGLVQELSRAPRDKTRREQVSELARLTDGKLLVHWQNRARLEATRRVPLLDAEAFRSLTEGRQMLDRAAFSRSTKVEPAKEKFAHFEKLARNELQNSPRAEARHTRTWISDFDNDPEGTIDRHCLLVMTDDPGFYGLPTSRALWPTPDQVPSLRAAMAFHLADTKVVRFSNRAIDPNDLYDSHNFIDGAYADHLLVNETKRFAVIARSAGRMGEHVRSLQVWAEEVLDPIDRSP
jgi:hypothetical protein